MIRSSLVPQPGYGLAGGELKYKKGGGVGEEKVVKDERRVNWVRGGSDREGSGMVEMEKIGILSMNGGDKKEVEGHQTNDGLKNAAGENVSSGENAAMENGSRVSREERLDNGGLRSRPERHALSPSPPSFQTSHSGASESTESSPLLTEEVRVNVGKLMNITGANSVKRDAFEDAHEHIDPLHVPAIREPPRVDDIKPLQNGIRTTENSETKSKTETQDGLDKIPAGGNLKHWKDSIDIKVEVRASNLELPNQGRRNTAPNTSQVNSAAELTFKRHGTSPRQPLLSRSTHPSIQRLRSYEMVPRRPSYDSTSSEINRMKNSLLVQRNLRKRKTTIEDEKVLVGNKISEGHENFVMAYNMLTGIRVAVSRCAGIMKTLLDEDFKATKKLSFNMEGNELTPSSKYDFKFKDYCPEVFRDLRSIFGIDPADYLISVTGKYILSELGSPGKSGSFFYYSRDYRFIIKTIHHSEHKQLLHILKRYYNHVKSTPNTLISQFYGLHRVKMLFRKGGVRKVHFVVMNNLFPPHRDLHLKYDLKGSTFGRKFNIPPSESSNLSKFTLKDLNWLERKEKIKFGPEKRKLFFQQLEKDVGFLESINVMDYSLLLGIHDVNLGNTTETTQRLSIFGPKSTDKFDLLNTNPREIDIATDLPSNSFQGRLKFIFYGHDGGIRATNENNDPLPEIYYLGVIDCLTNYSLKKRLETLWRSIGNPRRSISALPAKEYGERFLRFIKDGTSNEKSKIS